MRRRQRRGEYSKPCRRDACATRITKPTQWELDAVTYCSHRCANIEHSAVILRARQDRALQRACRQIQQAVGVPGRPSLALVNAVRRLRKQSYGSGWSAVQNRVRRAVARGVLVHRKAVAHAG